MDITTHLTVTIIYVYDFLQTQYIHSIQLSNIQKIIIQHILSAYFKRKMLDFETLTLVYLKQNKVS